MSSSAINETLTPAAFTSFTQGQKSFDPWSVPDSFTVYVYAPDYVKPLLHPHWETQKAVHPLWAYFFGLYYLVMGIYILDTIQIDVAIIMIPIN